MRTGDNNYYTPQKPRSGPTAQFKRVEIGIPHDLLRLIDEAVLNDRVTSTRPKLIREMLDFAWQHREELPAYKAKTGKNEEKAVRQ